MKRNLIETGSQMMCNMSKNILDIFVMEIYRTRIVRTRPPRLSQMILFHVNKENDKNKTLIKNCF